MPDAARSGDPHQCPHSDGGHPHVGGPIEASASTTVVTGHKAQARAGDPCRCHGPLDFIVTGSSSVYVDGKPAARAGDVTMHNPAGAVTSGLASVSIGGPRQGGIVGVGVGAMSMCEAAADGRNGGRTSQSYGNCGIESMRQIINRFRPQPINEHTLLYDAIDHGEARDHIEAFHRGSTMPEGRKRTLARYGVPSDLIPNEMGPALLQAIAEGRGVITAHVTGVLWETKSQGGHAVLATGAEFDDDGRLVAVIINDTGRGRCGDRVPVQRFIKSLLPGSTANVTRASIR